MSDDEIRTRIKLIRNELLRRMLPPGHPTTDAIPALTYGAPDAVLYLALYDLEDEQMNRSL